MKKFKVLAKSVSYCEIVVEAETSEQAEALAKEMDAGDFITCEPEQGYFQVCDGEAKEVVSAEHNKVLILLEKAYELWHGYIGNKGKLNYSDKQYGYLSDEIEEVEVGYLKLDNDEVDSSFANELRSQGFTMTAEQAIQSLSHRIQAIESEIQ